MNLLSNINKSFFFSYVADLLIFRLLINKKLSCFSPSYLLNFDRVELNSFLCQIKRLHDRRPIMKASLNRVTPEGIL